MHVVTRGLVAKVIQSSSGANLPKSKKANLSADKNNMKYVHTVGTLYMDESSYQLPQQGPARRGS